MKKEFCTYEQSLALKELGFNEPCIGYFEDDFGYLFFSIDDSFDFVNSDIAIVDFICTVPLIQQAFRFFREKYGYWCIIEEVEKSLYNFRIWDAPLENFLRENDIFWGGDYNTYEEAEQACLDKLIELARSVSDSEQTKESKQ